MYQNTRVSDSRKASRGGLRVWTLESALLDSLRSDIIRGELPTGSQVRLRELAQRYEVSLTPVRNALARLEAEGYVTMSPRRGVEVTRLSVEDIEELVLMREAIEGFAAEMAAKAITRPGLEVMKRHFADERAALASETMDPHRQIELDHDFHMALYETLERPSLIEKIETLRQRTMVYMYTAASQIYSHEHRALETHAALLGAVSRSDGAAARELTVEHIRHLRATVTPLLVDNGSSRSLPTRAG